MDPELVSLGASLGEAALRNTATAVATKITAVKASRKDGETIATLEEIISNLIEDRSEVIRIAQAYQEKLAGEIISSDDIQYISDNIIPAIEGIMGSGLASEVGAAQFDAVKGFISSLLSVETFNILQIIGFNFKAALGDPLTALLAQVIDSQGVKLVASGSKRGAPKPTALPSGSPRAKR